MYFPSVHVENFFEDPYQIIDFAKRLPFEKQDNQNFPGLRSPSLSQVNLPFFQDVCKRQLSIFYSKEEMQEIRFVCEARFQLIKQQESVPFVHQDDPGVLTTITYLTPNEEQSGTSVVAPTTENSLISPKPFPKTEEEHMEKVKSESFNNPEEGNFKKATEVANKYNDTFKEVTRFNSIFNSVSMFNSSSHHQAHFNPNGGERLTLICVYYSILAPRFPIPESGRVKL